MKSTYEMIKRKATESPDGYYKFLVDKPSELLVSFSVGVGEHWYSEKDEHGLKIEVWISTRIKLKDVPKFNEGVVPVISVIEKYDDITDEEREKSFTEYGIYDYHLPYVPSAYVADFFPYLYPHDISVSVKAVGDDESEVTFDKDSLAGFALSHGCDFMDMNSLTTYRRL